MLRVGPVCRTSEMPFSLNSNLKFNSRPRRNTLPEYGPQREISQCKLQFYTQKHSRGARGFKLEFSLAAVRVDHLAATEQGDLGVVIVDHGSKRKASNDMLIEFVELYK